MKGLSYRSELDKKDEPVEAHKQIAALSKRKDFFGEKVVTDSDNLCHTNSRIILK